MKSKKSLKIDCNPSLQEREQEFQNEQKEKSRFSESFRNSKRGFY